MSSEVSVVFTAEDAVLWAAIQRQIGASKKLGDEVQGAGRKGRESSEDMKRFADMVTRVTTTPVERYNASIGKLKTLLDAGKISQEKYTAAEAHFKQELDKATASVDRNAAAVSRSQTAQQHFGSSTNAAAGIAGRAVGAVAGLATSYLSLQTALSLANEFLDEHAKRAERALELHTKLATVQEASFKNLTGLGSGQKLDAHNEAVRISAETGADPIVVEKAIGDVFGVVGDIGKAQDAVRVAARESPLNDAEIPKAAGSRAMIGKASGVASPERVAGFHLSLQSTSIVPDNAQLAKAIVPLLSSVRTLYPEQQGETLSTQMGAVHSVLGALAGDSEGMSTTTSAIKLTSELDRFFDKHPELKKRAGTPEQQIRLIQDDSTGNLRKQLLGNEGIGEAQFKAPIEALLTKGSEAAALFEQYAKSITFDASLHDQAVRETQLTPSQRVAIAKKRSEATSQLYTLEDDAKARAALAAQSANRALGETYSKDVGGLASWAGQKVANTVAAPFTSDKDIPAQKAGAMRLQQESLVRQAKLPKWEERLLERTASDKAIEFLKVDPDIEKRIREFRELMGGQLTVERMTEKGIDKDTQGKVLRLQDELDLFDELNRQNLEAKRPRPAPAHTPAEIPRSIVPPEIRQAAQAAPELPRSVTPAAAHTPAEILRSNVAEIRQTAQALPRSVTPAEAHTPTEIPRPLAPNPPKAIDRPPIQVTAARRITEAEANEFWGDSPSPARQVPRPATPVAAEISGEIPSRTTAPSVGMVGTDDMTQPTSGVQTIGFLDRWAQATKGAPQPLPRLNQLPVPELTPEAVAPEVVRPAVTRSNQLPVPPEFHTAAVVPEAARPAVTRPSQLPVPPEFHTTAVVPEAARPAVTRPNQLPVPGLQEHRTANQLPVTRPNQLPVPGLQELRTANQLPVRELTPEIRTAATAPDVPAMPRLPHFELTNDGSAPSDAPSDARSDDRTAMTLERVGSKFATAVSMFGDVVDKLNSSPRSRSAPQPERQLTPRPMRDYSAAARREQAFAAG